MTPEQQRIVIATECGWKKIDPPMEMRWGEQSVQPEWWYVHHLPDYCNDLNAMHEAEKVLTDDQCDQYGTIINGIMAAEVEPSSAYSTRLICDWHATAAQRAEAFLKTIGKWKP